MIDGVVVVEDRVVGIAVENCIVVVEVVGVVMTLDGLSRMDEDILDILLCSLEMAAAVVQAVQHSAVSPVRQGKVGTEEEDSSTAEPWG